MSEAEEPESVPTEVFNDIPVVAGKRRGEIYVEQSLFQGPLPHPEILSAYDSVVPGSARQIMDDFLVQSGHRRELEKSVVLSGIGLARTGQYLAFACVVLFLMLAVFLVFRDQAWPASLLGAGSLGTIVYIFVKGNSSAHQEQSAKRQKSDEITKD